MTDQEFQAWLFPPVLSTRRKWIIRGIMIGLTILAAYIGQLPT
jgi:hypothetical protein